MKEPEETREERKKRLLKEVGLTPVPLGKPHTRSTYERMYGGRRKRNALLFWRRD